jgi:hypothetical protein
MKIVMDTEHDTRGGVGRVTNSTGEDEGDISGRKTEGKRRMTDCRARRQPTIAE